MPINNQAGITLGVRVRVKWSKAHKYVKWFVHQVHKSASRVGRIATYCLLFIVHLSRWLLMCDILGVDSNAIGIM